MPWGGPRGRPAGAKPTEPHDLNKPDVLINTIGLAYGLLLIATAFVRSAFTEAMRIDALFIKDCTERTRPLNLLAGLLVSGYAGYSLFF